MPVDKFEAVVSCDVASGGGNEDADDYLVVCTRAMS